MRKGSKTSWEGDLVDIENAAHSCRLSRIIHSCLRNHFHRRPSVEGAFS